MKEKISAYFYAALSLFMLLWLAVEPQTAADSVRRALRLCAGTIIPSLLPFFTVSGLLSALGISSALSVRAEPVMRKLFRASGGCCAPFILGLTGGYPTGALVTAELVRRGELTPDEGARILPFCNNTGPAFIIGAVGAGVFSSGAYGAILYVIHILSAVAVGMLFSRGGNGSAAPARAVPAASFPAALTSSVKNAVGSVLNVCGFVIFFAVITDMLTSIGLIPLLVSRLAVLTGSELSFCRTLTVGFLELGGGIGAMAPLAASPVNLALAAFLLGFGGLSVHFQTAAAVEGAKIKCARHFVGRIVHGLISALIAYVVFTLLQI